MSALLGSPTRIDGLRTADLQDEFLIYEPGDGRVHVLNGVAREIWLLCDGRHAVHAIAQELCSQFDVDVATAEKDVQETLARLADLGLVRG